MFVSFSVPCSARDYTYFSEPEHSPKILYFRALYGVILYGKKSVFSFPVRTKILSPFLVSKNRSYIFYGRRQKI